jgi:cytochrome P450
LEGGALHGVAQQGVHAVADEVDGGLETREQEDESHRGRLATEDVELAGVHVPRRTIVVTLLGAANRDPAVFTEPDRFDVRRANAREHLAFSSGVHYCLGANLARLEGEVALRMLFDRFPDLSLAGQPHRRDTRTLWGYDAMPVALHGSSRPVQPVGA